MAILECVWKKDLSSECEFFHKEELSYILEDKDDCLVGLVFMDDQQANHFFESVIDCLAKLRECEDKQLPSTIPLPDTNDSKKATIAQPETTSLVHVSGMKRASSDITNYRTTNRISILGDPKLKDMFSHPFKSDKDAQKLIDGIRKRASEVTINTPNTMRCWEAIRSYITKRNNGDETSPSTRKRLSAKNIGAPVVSSFQHVQGMNGNAPNIEQLHPKLRTPMSQ